MPEAEKATGNTEGNIRTQAMKKLLLGALLIASVSAPALAQSFTPEFGSANVANTPLAERTNGSPAAYGAYAAEPAPSQYYVFGGHHDRRWNSPTKEQYQTAPYQDENY
jgi:hypothetical protein